MPTYYFKTFEEAPTFSPEQTIEFPTVDVAIEQARVALCEMAADSLSGNPLNMIGIEILDIHGVKQAEVRLLLDVLPGSSSVPGGL
jgi:hypothetical protein